MEVTTTVRHSCGCEAERRLTRYDPFDRVARRITEIRHLSPPDALLAAFEKQVAAAAKSCRKYWEKQLCPACWRREQAAS